MTENSVNEFIDFIDENENFDIALIGKYLNYHYTYI